MNWTTGPLDPAVYWRRRAVVGVPILIMLFVLATCAVKAANSNGSHSDKHTSPMAAAKSSSSASPSVTATPAVTPAPSQPATPSASAPPTQPAGPVDCLDGDISVTVSLAHQRYPTNSKLPVKLTVANTSGKPCNRDVGAGQQEIQVKSGDNRIWSSDDCTNDQAVDRRTVQPNEKLTYWVTWNSTTSSPSNCGKPPAAGPGTYQIVGRIGTKLSQPVTVVLT